MKTSVCVVSYGDLRQSMDAAVSWKKAAQEVRIMTLGTRVRSGVEVLETSLPGYRALMLIP